MHTKMRLFRWVDGETGENRSVVISGSLNPDSSSPFNDETVFFSDDVALIETYHRVYQAVLTLCDFCIDECLIDLLTHLMT